MKKIILISMMLCATLSAKGLDFKNPNGEPFLITIGGSSEGHTKKLEVVIPLSKWVTIKYTDVQDVYGWGNTQKEVIYLGIYDSMFDSTPSAVKAQMYNNYDYASLYIHIPLYKLWKK